VLIGDPVQVGDPEQLLENLDPEQREVATSLSGPLCVLAGAGTGKTRAITHRIAYGVSTGAFTATKVLAVTFTTRAAGEMRTRLHTLGVPGVQARTFHSAALRQARYFWPRVHHGELPTLVQSKLGLLGEASRRCRLRSEVAELKDLAAEVEWAKVSNVRPDDYAAIAARDGRALSSYDHETTARIFAAYEEAKRDSGRMDMEDVLLCAAGLLAEDPRVAAEIHSQYRWFVVDEFQDVNPLQRTLLDLWLGDRDELCVVGDPAQTIYSFAGASPEHLTGFRRRHPSAKSVQLVRNYRSTPQVVAVANALSGGSGGGALRAQRAGGSAVCFEEYADEVAEAESIAATISAVRDSGTPLRHVAVLFRINAQSEAFEDALAAHSIPYVVRGGERFFDRPEVRQAHTLIRGAARSTQRSEPGSPGGLVDEVVALLSGLGWSAAPPRGGGSARARWESFDALRGLAEEVAARQEGAELAALVDELDRRAAAQDAPVADGVTLATMHAAKGLEWPVVFVAGVHEGTVPIVYADTPAAVEEERRLLYVAATRAQDRLTVSWSLARSPGARSRRGPSRFLDGVRPQSSAQGGSTRSRQSPRPRRRGAAAATCRVCSRPLADTVARKLGRCTDCPSTYDEELFHRLRVWRGEQAAAEKVPAYCVFTDATLTAIAETAPGDAAALVKLPGIGKVKLDKYAAQVLRICRTE
jgi:DNA helicase-2/ATP-dependent DNA helicase PcrA